MYTFNLGLVFGRAEHVIIIVCASEDPIDTEKVNICATKYFQQAMQVCDNLEDVLNHTAKSIKKECGCSTLFVNADCACMIDKKQS